MYGKLELLEEALDRLCIGDEFLDALREALQQPRVLLKTREKDADQLFITVAMHCSLFDQVDAMVMLLQAFETCKDLAQLLYKLKDWLIRNIVSKAAIVGLFHCTISDSEAFLIVKSAETRSIVPGLWSIKGLRFPVWIEYSIEYSQDAEFKEIASKAFDDINSASSDALDPTVNGNEKSNSDTQINNIIERIYSLANSDPLEPVSEWKEWLCSSNYRVRCAAADLVGVYAGSQYQEHALQMLMQSRSHAPPETILRGAANACIRLARLQNEPPIRSEELEEHLQMKNDMVLPLTQQQLTQPTHYSPNSHRGFLDNSSAKPYGSRKGTWSYLECFQGQSVLYMAFIDAFKEDNHQAMLVAHHFKVISRALHRTPWQLCQPFWPVIAPKLLKHYNRSMIESFCNLVLGVRDTNFLLRTASLTIPHLCVSGKTQLRACDDIAEVRGCSTRRVLIEHAAAIIAALLLSSSHKRPIKELDRAWNDAEDRFISLHKSFRTFQFNKFLSPWRVDAIYEILMRTNDQNAEFAVGFISKIMDCVYASAAAESYRSHKDDSHEILQQTIFRLVVKFSDTMRNLMGRQSLATKISVLMGLRIVIERFFSPDLMSSVLRQLTACLQSALEVNQLTLAALQTWLEVVKKLDDSKLEAIIDLTYSIINERIDTWDQDCVNCAKSIVIYVKSRVDANPENFEKIHPQSAFDSNNEMSSDQTDGINISTGSGATSRSYLQSNSSLMEHSSYDILASLVERDIENLYIAKQTARDICAFGLEFQSEIISWAQAEGTGHELLGRAVRVLLNLCGKDHMDLQRTSVRALGLLGALDPHKTSIQPKDPPLIMVSNFYNFSEVLSLCKTLVQDWFLPSFEAAIDPDTQRYFAYGIQELLKFISAEDQASLKRIFEDDSLASTLLPLLKTKYTTEMKHWTAPTYPIYYPGKPFTEWLISFCSDMMARITEPEYAVTVFSWCRKILYGSNSGPEMWSYLLPYAALAAVVDPRESKSNQEIFLQEVLFILGLSGTTIQPAHEQIFATVDYFNQWMRSRRQLKEPLLGIDKVLAEIPAKLMAQRALESGAYPRAIRYYEQQMHEERDSELSVLQNLRHMYGTMQDIDSLEGISALMPVLSIEQQVLEYRATSQWDAALACYNALPTNEETMTATLECLHHSGRDKEVLAELNNGPLPGSMITLGAECAWTVRDWQALEKWTMSLDPSTDYIHDGLNSFKNSGSTNSQLQSGAVQALGSALLALLSRDWDAFKTALETGREHIGFRLGEIVSTHHVTSLRQIRDLMVYLHGLADVESLGTIVMPNCLSVEDLGNEETANTIRSHLDQRLCVLSTLNEGPEFEAKRFLLYLRAAALSCIEDLFPCAQKLIAEAHLEVSANARNHKQPAIALMEIAIAKQLDHSKADVEHARLLWSQGESRSAIRMLQSQIPPDFFAHPKKHQNVGKLALDWTTWRDMGAQADTKVIVENYRAVIKSLPDSSEAQYRLAKHYVKIYDQSPVSAQEDGVLAKEIVIHYSRALLLGTPHHTEALPKMLTTWLDLGLTPHGISGSHNNSRRHNINAANKAIDDWGKQIDRKLVYNAIPQLLSRLNHPNKHVQTCIEQLIIPVLQLFPHHTLWYILEKGDQTKKIVKEASLKTKNYKQSKFADLLHNGKELFEKLKIICNIKPKLREVKLVDFGEDFSKCLQRPILAVPVQSNMDSLEDVLIYEIDSRVIVQQSLQRPKRITVWGNDGKAYQLLLKGQDDVRKDARLIEFTSAVNQLLRSNAAAAARHLNILNYRVTPLSASAGIIEWVQGALPARLIIKSLSRRPDFGQNTPEYKRVVSQSNKISDRINAFLELERMVPPVLWEWFVDTFPDPEAWLGARTRYARSLSVMSMVGYILGLGDRHLENILLIQNSGSILHVDFDCLFDKGKHLNVPELVPFRLTQQFRDALGVVNGYEGPFRKVSELTLNIVRSNEDLLMVVLEAFVHDPVVQDRINNLNPTEALARTRAKIRGISESNSAPLSVGGLVDELIQTAVSPELLCQMFRGWLPWI